MSPLPAAETQTPVPAVDVQSGVLTHIFSVLGIVSLVFLFFFIGVFVEGWTDYHAVEAPHIKVEALRNLMLAAGAAGAVIVGTWCLAFAAVRTHALNRQAKVAETDSKFSERKHQAEAFAKAIEQLGNEDSFAVRLGAVYALEALARSSKELHGPIFETLCAYVREKAPAKGITNLRPTNEDGEDIDDLLEPIDPPHVVVQAILTVAGRRDPKRDPKGFRLDLRNTNLRRADLCGDGQRSGYFENALFTGAHLEGTDLIHAHLEGAELGIAHLEGAYLINTHLEGANLMAAHLENANLKNAHLEGANLFGVHLKGAYLVDAHLEGTELWSVYFDTNTIVRGANFQGALGIPAQPGNDFRATIRGADTAHWPDDDDADAWHRDEPDVDAG